MELKQLFGDVGWNEWGGLFCYCFPHEFLSAGQKNDCVRRCLFGIAVGRPSCVALIWIRATFCLLACQLGSSRWKAQPGAAEMIQGVRCHWLAHSGTGLGIGSSPLTLAPPDVLEDWTEAGWAFKSGSTVGIMVLAWSWNTWRKVVINTSLVSKLYKVNKQRDWCVWEKPGLPQ